MKSFKYLNKTFKMSHIEWGQNWHINELRRHSLRFEKLRKFASKSKHWKIGKISAILKALTISFTLLVVNIETYNK